MSDPNDRLREKTVMIAALNQKLETLQAQLSGAQKRSLQLGEKVSQLESDVSKRDYEIQSLKADLSRTQGALETVGKEMREIKSGHTQSLSRAKPQQDSVVSKEELLKAERKIATLKADIKLLSEAATEVLLGDDEAMENLREVVRKVGDPRYRIINLVLEKRSVKIDELASILVMDISEIREITDMLQTEGEIMFKDESTVIPAKKYREVKIPLDDWRRWDPFQIFESLEEIIEKAEGNETIVEALENAVDIIEQKLARGGALIFQMRKTAGFWKRQAGDTQELLYTIKDWKSRALQLS